MSPTDHPSTEPRPGTAFDRFERVLDPDVFTPVSATCWLGLTDVVGSTAAIAAGRYKAVNMAGAAVISALMNRIPRVRFPFVFGGDGATFVIEDADAEAARATLAATSTWCAEELGLALRGALVPLAAIRAAGHDLKVAWFAASEGVAYAMLSGGGAQWAEAEMKAGRFAVPPAPPGTRPDLSGLSCRWQPIDSRNGAIASLIVRPHEAADPARFADTVRALLATVAARERAAGTPVEADRLAFRWPPAGLDLEARALAGAGSVLRRKVGLWLFTLFAFLLFRTGWKAGAFDPARYRGEVARNSDYRKFDDGLRMTLDCAPGTLAALEELLSAAAAGGIVRYGLHRQSSALMTCIVPSPTTNTHMHFIDGADGGYARAAQVMKGQA